MSTSSEIIKSCLNVGFIIRCPLPDVCHWTFMTEKGFCCTCCLNTFLGLIQETTNQWTETQARTRQEIRDPHVTPKHNRLLRLFHALLASNKPEVPRKRFPPTLICLNWPKLRCSACFALCFNHCILLVGWWILLSPQVRNRNNIFFHQGNMVWAQGRFFIYLFIYYFTVNAGLHLELARCHWWAMDPCSSSQGGGYSITVGSWVPHECR